METLVSRTNIDTFVIWSGDSDFAPLASRLREHGKTVLGFGLAKGSASSFRQTCDEFFTIPARSDPAAGGDAQEGAGGGEVPLRTLVRRACRTLAANGSGEWVLGDSLLKYLTRLQPDVRSMFNCRWSEYLKKHGRFQLWSTPEHKRDGQYWVRVMSKDEAEAKLGCSAPDSPSMPGFSKRKWEGRPVVDPSKRRCEDRHRDLKDQSLPDLKAQKAAALELEDYDEAKKVGGSNRCRRVWSIVVLLNCKSDEST